MNIPELYGTIGSGDDGPAIAAALASERPVQLLARQYTVNDPIFIPESGALIGAGHGASVIKAASSFNVVFLGNNSSLSNLTVEGSGASGSGVLIDNVSGARVCNVYATKCAYHGFAVTNSARNNFLNNIEASFCGHRGVLLDPGATDNILSGIYSHDNDKGGILIGHGSHRNHISNFIIERINESGLWVHNDSSENIITGGMISYSGSLDKVGIVLMSNAYKNVLSQIIVKNYQRGLLLRGSAADEGTAQGDTRDNLISNLLLIGPGSAGVGMKFDSLDGGATKVKDNSLSSIKILGFANEIEQSFAQGNTITSTELL